MSILGIVTGTNPVKTVISRDDSEAPGLTLDAAMSITPVRGLDITKNPVESGGNITDNAAMSNWVIEMEAMVAEDPLPDSILESALGILAGSAGGAIGVQVGRGQRSLVTAGVAVGVNKLRNFALSPNVVSGEQKLEQQIANRDPGDRDYARKAYEYLLSLQESRVLLRIVSEFKTYNSLLMTKISAPRNIQNGRSLVFTATFEQVQIVSSNEASLPENLISFDALGAASKANKGKQATSQATEAQSSNVSALKNLVNGFGS